VDPSDLDPDEILAVAQASPSGLRQLFDRFSETDSPIIAKRLIFLITQCRRAGPVPPSEAILLLSELLEKMDVWSLGQRVPEVLLSALYSAIYEDGLPVGFNRAALAGFIVRFSSQDDPVDAPADDFRVLTINVCASLAMRDELLSVLATHPGAREEMLGRVEAILERFAKTDAVLLDLYRDEAAFALESLRAD
jgi:hypothetical protein